MLHSRHFRLLVACTAFAIVAPAMAQESHAARVPLVPSDTKDPIVGPIFDAIKSRGGEPLNMHRAVANSPKIFKSYVDMAVALRAGATTPRVDRELIILRFAQLAGGQYQRAILAYAEGMASANGVDDAAFAALKKHFNDQEIVEPTVTAAFYGAVSQITRALDVKLEANAGQTAYGAC